MNGLCVQFIIQRSVFIVEVRVGAAYEIEVGTLLLEPCRNQGDGKRIPSAWKLCRAATSLLLVLITRTAVVEGWLSEVSFITFHTRN